MTKLLLIAILLFGFHSKSILPIVVINSVNKDIETFARVDCSRFDDSFEKSEVKKKQIIGKGRINNLLTELENLKEQNRKNGTDTRATITIKYPDRTETICADRFSIYRNGTCYEITDNLKKLIW